MNGHKVVDLVAHQSGKRTANNYCIKINPVYLAEILQGFRGKGSAEYVRQHTDELWDAMTSGLTCAQYGAFRRILAMFARSKQALKEKMIFVTQKELISHGISMHLFQQVQTKVTHLDISLVTEAGEIKDLEGGSDA